MDINAIWDEKERTLRLEYTEDKFSCSVLIHEDEGFASIPAYARTLKQMVARARTMHRYNGLDAKHPVGAEA